MSASDPSPDTIGSLIRAATACILPFFLAGAGGDTEAAYAVILQIVNDYKAVTAAELNLVVQIVNFGAAAMDNLRESTRPGLSDTKLFKFRAGAIALERSAERCRKALEAMQAKRPPAAVVAVVSPPMTTGAQPAPKASVPTAPQATAMPAPVVAAPVVAAPFVDDNYEFESDIGAMRRNALAMIAVLQAGAASEYPETPVAQAAPDLPRAINPGAGTPG